MQSENIKIGVNDSKGNKVEVKAEKFWKNKLPTYIFGLLFIAALLVSINKIHADNYQVAPSPVASGDDALHCIEVGEGGYVCGTPEDIAKAASVTTWYDATSTPDKVDDVLALLDVRITRYSPADSCHYPAPGGGCYSANWPKKIEEGDFACPEEFKFGLRVRFPDGVVRTCNDRPAKWLAKKYPGTPTFDIYVPDCSGEKCGMQFAQVAILKD